MAHTSFSERIERIEMAKGMPVASRLLAGVSEEIDKPASSRKSGGSAGKAVRFGMGFVLMFACFGLARRIPEIHTMLGATDQTAPFANMIMVSIGVCVAFAVLFFAFKLSRAIFRVTSEPARLPFAIGMVLGLALSLGPVELTDTVMAQLQ